MAITVRTRGRLPHWTKPGADYFVTFRTIDSISAETVAASRLTQFTPDQIRRKIEIALDGCDRGDILRGAAAEAVASSVRFGHERNYLLHTCCVMPNHVHLLLREVEGTCLAWAMQMLKSHSAHELNKLLGRSGPIWEKEYFDRLVRPGQFERVRRYVLTNPEKAHLRNWAWVGCIVADETSALLT